MTKVTATAPTVGEKSIAAMLRAIDAETFKTPPPNSFTTRQYAKENDLDANTALRRINALVRLGKIKAVGSFSVCDSTGNRKQFTPHFQLTAKK